MSISPKTVYPNYLLVSVIQYRNKLIKNKIIVLTLSTRWAYRH